MRGGVSPRNARQKSVRDERKKCIYLDPLRSLSYSVSRRVSTIESPRQTSVAAAVDVETPDTASRHDVDGRAPDTPTQDAPEVKERENLQQQ